MQAGKVSTIIITTIFTRYIIADRFRTIYFQRGAKGSPTGADQDAAALFAEAQAKAREQAAYEQLKASGKKK